MPRIGTVIRDVYRRPGANELPGHLERRYGITVRAMTTLAPGVYKIDRGDGPPRDDCSGLPAAFAHPDPVPVNAISARGEPVLIDWTGAGTGPRLASLATLVHSAGPRRAAAVMAGYSACQQLTPDELDRVEGVLWIRALWLAAWQCWLAAVTGRARRAGVPDASGIAALAAAARETAR